MLFPGASLADQNGKSMGRDSKELAEVSRMTRHHPGTSGWLLAILVLILLALCANIMMTSQLAASASRPPQCPTPRRQLPKENDDV